MCILFLIILFIACLCSLEISHDQMNWRDEGVYGVLFEFLFLDLTTSIMRPKWGVRARETT
jgi:hypothetical protein